MTRQLKASHQQRKTDRKDAEDFPFYFPLPSSQLLDIIQAEVLFTDFLVVHNISLPPIMPDSFGAFFLEGRNINLFYPLP